MLVNVPAGPFLVETQREAPRSYDAGKFGDCQERPRSSLPHAGDLDKLRLTAGTNRGTDLRTRCIDPDNPLVSNGQHLRRRGGQISRPISSCAASLLS